MPLQLRQCYTIQAECLTALPVHKSGFGLESSWKEVVDPQLICRGQRPITMVFAASQIGAHIDAKGF